MWDILNITKRTDTKEKGTRMDTLWEQDEKGQTKKNVGGGNYKDRRDCLWEGYHGTDLVREDE